MFGFPVEILEAKGFPDCSLNGVSHRFKQLYIVDPRLDPLFKIDNPEQAIRIVTRNFGGVPYLHAEPLNKRGHAMAGGRFVWSCDSRFRRVSPYPIAIHDRYEMGGALDVGD